jgi:hypothetical protein
MFSFNKSRRISLIMALFVLLAFSTCALADHVHLTLKAPAGVSLNAQGLTLSLYQGTGTTNRIDPQTTSANEYFYSLVDPGTYNYRVSSSPNTLYYGVTKILHFTEEEHKNEAEIEIVVDTGPRPQGTETFGPASVSIFTNQIINKLFGTVGVLAGFPADGLKTPTFTTQKGKFEVATQTDLMTFVSNIVANNPKAHLYSLGKTQTLNYDIPIVIVTNSFIPAGASFEQAAKAIRDSGKPTFFHQGSIHGDEESAAEGAMAMLLEVVGSYGAPLLEKVNYVCVPRFNVEGAARWTRSSITPVIDMNRDHLRLRAPEVRMVHKGYLEIMPEVTMDGHEIGYFTVSSTISADAPAYATGGITDLESTPSTSMINPSSELNDLALDVYGVRLHGELATGGIRSNHYENASNGWTANHGIGRAYYGLMGSVSFLVEVRGTGSLLMARRAYAHVLAAKSLMETLYANDTLTRNLVKQAREDVIKQGKVYNPNVMVPLYQYASGAGTAYMNTGAETPGSRYSKYATQRHQADMLGNLMKVNLTDSNAVVKTHAINDATHFERSRPTAYVIPKGIADTTVNSGDYAINYGYLIEMLKANRIEYYEIKEGYVAPVRQYYYVSGNGTTQITPTATINTNVLRAGLRDEEKVTFTNGAYVIPLDQEAGAVAVSTFEPDVSNSNGYNASVAQSLTGAEGLAVVFQSSVTNNYPYYRLEKSNPRDVLVDKDKECKTEIPECIEEILDTMGCNAGFGLLILIFAAPFIARKRH